MNDKAALLERIEDSAATLLGGGTPPDKGIIISTVQILANSQMQQIDKAISEQDILNIIRRLENRFDITMKIGNLLSAEGYTPWLDERRQDIDWYYWARYKRLLPEKKFSREVISVLDINTNKILDHIEYPKKEGSWKRKGLCVGHVQSGKTAN
ncbi:hypothetical protein, partial [Candidatus Venteria ishoeyi]